MYSPKISLFATIILATVSIANADLALTINGFDATKQPEIAGKDNLVIAIAGQSEVKSQDISVTCDRGKLESLKKTSKGASGKYLFSFTGGSEVATISLNDGKEVVYKLILFYIPETDNVIVFGVDKEALTPPQPQPESDLELGAKQQIFASQTAETQKSFSAGMSGGRTTGIDSFPEPNSYPDFNGDKIVNFVDFAIFAGNWKKSGSGLDGDFDKSGAVDTTDLATFAYLWLNGPHPLNVFEPFKTALSAGDVNEALTYIAEISREKYAEIFRIIEPNLPDYVAGMGQMIFDRHRFGEVKYEMLHQDGPQTLGFPVFFIRDENGNWTLFNF